ncbi:MAG: hypothetical protein ACRCX2_15710 [Paraclostridium sp.]
MFFSDENKTTDLIKSVLNRDNTDEGKSSSYIMRYLPRAQKESVNNLISGDNRELAIIEREFKSAANELNPLKRKLESEITEIKTRIREIKAMNDVESEVGMYSVLNQWNTNLIRLVEKQSDFIDKKHKSILAQRKFNKEMNPESGNISSIGVNSPASMFTNTADKTSGIQRVSQIVGRPVSSLGVDGAVTKDDMVSYFKHVAQTKSENEVKVPHKEVNERLEEFSQPQVQIDQTSLIIDTNPVVETPVEETPQVQHNGVLPDHVLNLINQRKNSEDSIMKEPNGLGMIPELSANAIKAKSIPHEMVLHLAKNTGEFWVTASPLNDDGDVLVNEVIETTLPSLGQLGSISVDNRTKQAFDQLNFKYHFVLHQDDSLMSEEFRNEWASGYYNDIRFDVDETLI